MQNSTQFQVYNASAGSGKTFTLVKEYLKILLVTDNIFRFQNILAITFTNKAAAEMKERVLQNLRGFSEGEQGDLFQKIKEECNLTETVIKERSKRVLNSVLQNYSAFNITTIDSFTYRIVRSFAFDLGLSLNFEVEMDAKSIVNEAVDLLISKIGSNQQLTKTLIDFSLDKTEEDKAWDIALDLKEFASILLNENDTLKLKKLEIKTVQDFIDLKSKLKKEQIALENEGKRIGEKGIETIESVGLEFKDFYYSMLPKHFLSLCEGVGTTKFFSQNKLRDRIEENVFYSKNKSENIKASIEEILPVLLDLYQQSEKIYQQYLLNSLVLKGLIPLAVLKHINESLTEIKEQNNIRLNAEFNQLIFEQIKNEPAPFIYERIGEKFKYYFIDEMQDTSRLQWQNLIPLIENSLTSETLEKERGNLLLVGDAKQAIYRWRGGEAEQFIGLATKDNPFPVKKALNNLDTNYRSYSEIITFNNQFFTHIADFFGDDAYKELYKIGNTQKTNNRTGGYVQISFIEKPIEKEEKELTFPKKVLEVIHNLDSNFDLSDVCILVRKKKEGIAVANYLTEQGVNIVSSETLLLKNNETINFIINILSFLHLLDNKAAIADALYYLAKKVKVQDVHEFVSDRVLKSSKDLFASLHEFDFCFDENEFMQLPFYDGVEYLIRSFQLIKGSDAFVQSFLDVILEFQNKKGSDLAAFLEYWELQQEKLSIAIPEIKNAVKIMTIHKSKGLEFPIVICPYDLTIHKEVKPKIWYDDLDKEYFSGFETALIDYSSKVSFTSEYGEQLYTVRRNEVELDNLNLLYVALTRSVEQLYIISENQKKPSPLLEAKKYSDLFLDFLSTKTEQDGWIQKNDTFLTGNPARVSLIKEGDQKVKSIELKKFISSSWKNNNIQVASNASLLWDTEKGVAINYGNLLHTILSKINTKEDVEAAVQNYVLTGVIEKEKAVEIKQRIYDIVTHPELKSYYQPNLEVLNEREILTIDKHIQIPDRIVVYGKKIVLIDYKTGKGNTKYQIQLNNYANSLYDLGYSVLKMMLVYIDKQVRIEMVKKS